MRYCLALVLVGTLALLPACAKKSTTYNTPNGPVTVTQESGVKQVTVHSSEGTTTIGVGAVDPASLGLPVYPGATPNQGGSFASQTNQGGAKVVTLQTTDSFDKVYAFYKDKMPAGSEKMKVSSAGASMANFQIGGDNDKTVKHVNIVGAQGKVNITLIVSSQP